MFTYLSGILLFIGAMVGGGILAIPIASAYFGFITTFTMIIAAWVLMTQTGLYILDLCLSCPVQYNSYYSIVGKYLGKTTQYITIFLFLWLLYFSLSSYISGSVSVLSGALSLTTFPYIYSVTNIIYVLLFGGLLLVSTKLIVRLNAFIVCAKLILLIITIAATHQLARTILIPSTQLHLNGISTLFIIITNAFGFHYIIPSFVSYYGKDNAVFYKKILIAATTCVMILYASWLYTIYAIIPSTGTHGLIAIYQSENQLIAFNNSLNFYLKAPIIIQFLNLFELVALFGSFFCTALSIYDFYVDVLKSNNKYVVGLLTFVPAVLLSLFSQNMYIYAMTIAGFIAFVLEIIIPVFAIRYFKIKKQVNVAP